MLEAVTGEVRVISEVWRWCIVAAFSRLPNIGSAGRRRPVQFDRQVVAEDTAPPVGILGVEKTAIACFPLPNRFVLVCHSPTPSSTWNPYCNVFSIAATSA